MKTRDLKSLSETVASVVDPIIDSIVKERAQMLQEGFLNSLTEKARQIASKEMEDEDEEEEEDEMEDEGEEEEKPTSKKKSKKQMNEKAAPGMEDWASDPKVKASFKKQYGKRWKEVMYGRSWNLAKQENKLGLDEEEQLDELTDALISRARNKAILRGPAKRGFVKKATKRLQSSGAMAPRPSTSTERDSQWNKAFNEETDLDEAVSAKRMRIIRKYVKGNKRVPEHLKDYMERSFKKKRFKDKQLSDGRGAVGALETRMRRKSAALRARGVEPKGVAPGYLEEEWGGGFQSYQDAQRQVQAGLRSDAARERRTKINDIKAVLAGKMTKNAFTKKHRTKFSEHPLTKKIVAAREKAKASYLAKKTAKGLSEDTLDEGILKKLRRAKGAAYAAMQKGEGDKYAKLHGVASGLESRYKASMARRGGATPETVKGAGSRLSKKGKYTLKAGKLATQHDKATRSFRSMAGVKELINKGEDKAEKRARQQAQAKFRMDARHGDFGYSDIITPEIKKAGMRARYNYEKRYGRLKGK